MGNRKKKSGEDKFAVKCLEVAIFIFISILLNSCSKDNIDDSYSSELGSLFNNFKPVYYYNDEATEMLGHACFVYAAGHDAWSAYSGYCDSLYQNALNENSLFRIASATKMFTSVMILQMWEEGKIDLDTPFNDYLQLDEINHPKISLYDGVTIRHLLSHRSGICRISSTTFFDDYYYTDIITQDIRMEYLFSDCDPEFEPGEQYAYRNSNFNILGLVIEKISGNEYHEELESRICVPLNLSDTYLLDYTITGSDNNFAHGYTMGFDGSLYHGSQAWAAGGIVSTAHDLAVFMKALKEGELFDSISTFDLMKTPVEGGHYGLGIFISNTPKGLAYGHSGAIFGYNTRFEYFPAQEAIIVSTMSFNGYDFMVTNWYDDFCYPLIDLL